MAGPGFARTRKHGESVIGWGIHYFPGRGWTYNIWGFACVKLTLGRKIIRVGTDDADGLARFLGEKTGISGLSE